MDTTVDSAGSVPVYPWGDHVGAIPFYPPSWQELQEILPWAELTSDNHENEIVIYTGLAIVSPDGATEWMGGMI